MIVRYPDVIKSGEESCALERAGDKAPEGRRTPGR